MVRVSQTSGKAGFGSPQPQIGQEDTGTRTSCVPVVLCVHCKLGSTKQLSFAELGCTASYSGRVYFRCMLTNEEGEGSHVCRGVSLVEEQHRHKSQTARLQISALPLASCVTLSAFFPLSGPRFSHLSSVANSSDDLLGLLSRTGGQTHVWQAVRCSVRLAILADSLVLLVIRCRS